MLGLARFVTHGSGGSGPSLNFNFADNAPYLSQQITFTRASAGTFVGSNGLIQNAPVNLLTYSEQFNNAAWATTGASVAANIIVSPDGTVNGDNLIESFGSNAHRVSASISVTIGTIYTLSVYAKASTRTFLQVFFGATEFGTNAFANFNLSTGVLGTVGSNSTAVITPVGNGWYRCSVTAPATATGAAGFALIQIVTSSTAVRNENYTGDGTSGLFIWGAQLVEGSVAGPYARTVASTSGAPRFDYDPVTLAAKGLLIEEQRTNLLTYSERFDDASWTKTNATVTANAANSPDGTATADKLVENSATAQHYVSQNAAVTSGTTYAWSVFAAPAGRNWLEIQTNTAAGSISAFFDLVNGTVSNVSVGTTATISPAGGGYYRCTVSKAAASTGTGTVYFLTATAAGTSNYTGDGTSGVFLWGAQLEAGSFATSYIPTVASQVTRSADAASVNTLSPWYNATEGTFYAEFQTSFSGGLVDPSRLILLADASASKRIVYIPQGVQTAGTFDGTTIINAPGDVTGPVAKVASAYTASARDIVANGGTVATGASVAGYPASSAITIAPNTPAQQLCGHYRRITYYPRRLPNATLQQITS